jgi:hypothetical protein
VLHHLAQRAGAAAYMELVPILFTSFSDNFFATGCYHFQFSESCIKKYIFRVANWILYVKKFFTLSTTDKINAIQTNQLLAPNDS